MKKTVKLPIFRKTAEYEPIATQGVSLAMYQTQFFFLLLFSIVMLLSEQVYMIHERFYGGTLVEFKKDLYLIIGLYKMIWIFFNLIPYWVTRNMEKAA